MSETGINFQGFSSGMSGRTWWKRAAGLLLPAAFWRIFLAPVLAHSHCSAEGINA